MSAGSCSICGGKIGPVNKTGICMSNPECNRERHRKIWAMKKGIDYVPIQHCIICDGELASNNIYGICTSNEKCRSENWRKKWAISNGKEYDPAASCQICGKLIRSNNVHGICRTNPRCSRELSRKAWCMKRGVSYAPLGEAKTCEVCGAKLQRGQGKYNVCKNGSPDCKQEYLKRYRDEHQEELLDRSLTYSKSHRKERRSYAKEMSERQRHDEITYLMFSPLLGTHKIGKTVNILSRTRSLKGGCWDIELVTTFPYGAKLERWLHKKFKKQRIPRTEWFRDLTEAEVKDAVALYEQEVF